MGLGKEFWNLVRGCMERRETVQGLNDLRGKRLAIDLSYWYCAFKGKMTREGTNIHGVVRKPHLRNLFFRVVKLVSRVGALPVFVLDGEAPSAKARVRVKRYCASHGIVGADRDAFLASATIDFSGARNETFNRHMEEMEELLKLLGMPVLRARGEAEALCAELNTLGLVDACVSPDSDLLLFGALSVIKTLQVDFKNPFVESYEMSTITAKMGLGQNHLIALALLLGCDYCSGVKGIGEKTACQLVSAFSNDEVLDRWRRAPYARAGNAKPLYKQHP